MTSRGSSQIQANQTPTLRHKDGNNALSKFHYRTQNIGTAPRNTLIVMDDELIGDLVIAAAKALVLGSEITPLTLILIGFGDVESSVLMETRGRYLTFSENCLRPLNMEAAGYGRELLNYLDEEIIPLTTGIAGKPSLLGYSLSASFALHAAFAHGLPVGKIGAISPSLWAEPIASSLIAQTLERDADFVLHLSAGRKETDRALTGHDQHMFEKVASLGEQLSDIFPTRTSWKIYENETHWSAPFASISEMLRRLSN